MRRMFAAELAELLLFQLIRRLLTVFGGSVVLSLTLGTIQTDNNSHGNSLKRYAAIVQRAPASERPFEPIFF